MNFLNLIKTIYKNGFSGSSVVKNLPANAGDMDLIPGSGRSAGVGNRNPLQYSCLENSMDRGALWATVHRVAKSQIWLSVHTHTHPHTQRHLWKYLQVSSNLMVTNLKLPWTGNTQSTGSLLEIQHLKPHPDLLNQNLWRWDSGNRIWASSPGDT